MCTGTRVPCCCAVLLCQRRSCPDPSLHSLLRCPAAAAAGAGEAWRLALHPELRKHAAKWVHRAEWERSIRESHAAGPALDEALRTFRREVDVIGRALAPLLPSLAAGVPPGGLPRPAWF